MNLYTGSNDVLYWLYNSHQISKGIYLLGFGIFTFWWGLSPLWPHFACFISMLSQPSWTVLWADTEITGLEEKHYLPKFGSLATLSFEICMNKPDSKFFCSDPESERLEI